MTLPRDAISDRLAAAGYIADRDIATALWLMEFLKRPLLLEGEAGVGKTEVAKALAAVHGAELIRLQCYEGLDQHAALYEWNYQRQLLAIKAREGIGENADAIEEHIFSERYLLERPLLAAIRREKPPVLLIDEVDRADEEFEAFLLELLSDFQVSIPELGTIRALSIPRVLLTSNGTRELSDALRRRCLYHYVDFPDTDREARIILARLPGIDTELALQVAAHGGGGAQGGFAQGPRRRRDTRLGRNARGPRCARPAPGTGSRARDDDVPAEDPRRPVAHHARGHRAAARQGGVRWARRVTMPKTSAHAARHRLAGFAHVLRDNGYMVGLAETRDALAILASPAAARPSSFEPALRALFCATRSDWEKFDEIFQAFWRGRGMRRAQSLTGNAGGKAPLRRMAEAGAAQGAAGQPDHVQRLGGDDGAAEGRGRREGASSADNLLAVDLRHITDPADVVRAHALAARLARTMRARLVRREQVRRRGRRLDLRRTIHRNVSHGGTPIDLAWRRRKIKPMRLVVLLDASGSMNLYTAFFVRFLHGVVDAFREAEAFVFHTRLAHVSASLRDRDVARAVDRLGLMAQGIGGGTRIGDSLATFNRWHARRLVNSRTAVMIVSDGYDTGEPERLGAEMRRLRQRCRRIIWLNPLIGWRDYSPQARGMQAALPYVDLFAPAHNLESLAALEPYFARI